MTIHILPIGMDDRKIAILRTAFRMHQSEHYAIVDDMFKDPDLAIADVDGPEGMSVLDPFFTEYPNTRLLITSINTLDLEYPSLLKPLRVETLFPMLRDIFAKDKKPSAREQLSKLAKQASSEDTHASVDKVEPKEAPPKIRAKIESEKQSLTKEAAIAEQPRPKEKISIPDRPNLDLTKLVRFDPSKGLLGRVKLAQRNGEKTMILYKGRPVLLVSPEDDLVILLVPLGTIRKLCELPDTENEANFALKSISIDSPPLQSHSIKLFNLLWQLAIWTANGRLVDVIKVNRPLKLKSWPNFTRLAPIPDAMRITAFLIRSPVNMSMLHKFLPVDTSSLMNFLAATYITDILMVEHAPAPKATHVQKEIKFVTSDIVNETAVESFQSENDDIVEESEITEQILIEEATNKPRSFLQKLLNKISNK